MASTYAHVHTSIIMPVRKTSEGTLTVPYSQLRTPAQTHVASFSCFLCMSKRLYLKAHFLLLDFPETAR